MRLTQLMFPLVGVALLAGVLYQTDVAVLWSHLQDLGWTTGFIILALYLVYFAADVVTWQAALPGLPCSLRWFARLYVVRMIGDAYNNVTPTASFGGEPVKAWLLKRHHGVPYRDAGASLVIARTATMFALVLFALVGLTLVLRRPGLSAAEQATALASLITVIAGTALIFGVQYFTLSSRLARTLSRTRRGARAERVLRAIEDIDRKFRVFYAEHQLRLGLAVGAALAAWLLGAIEAWIVLHALGREVAFSDIWIMEACVQIVRAATFFIPAGLGTQEAATYVMVQWLFGAPSVGVATAVIRRARELVWIAASLLIASAYALGPRRALRLRIDDE